MPQTTLRLPYGINTCHDLYEKLKFEAARLEKDWNIYDTFNFAVTAWHLHHDWIKRDADNRPMLATKKKEKPRTPNDMMLVIYTMRDIANSSKHFLLDSERTVRKKIDEIHPPEIRTYRALMTDKPQIGVKVGKLYFSMFDLKFLIMAYFDWIFDDSVPENQFPREIMNYLNNLKGS